MKNLLLKIFRHNLTERNWYNVIGWWEIRRLVFNIVLLVSGLNSLMFFLFVLKFDANIIHPFTIIGFALIANFCYTFGWIIELLVRRFNRKKASLFGINFFKIGLVASIFITFLPTIFYCANWLITGEKFTSPYSNYTKDKPSFDKIIGTYYLDTKNSSTGISDIDERKIIKISLNIDSTFLMKNIPVYGFEQNKKYELWSGKGTWKLELDQDHWIVRLNCKKLVAEENRPTSRDGFFTNEFSIYNDKPPYALYQIIGDPDAWTGAFYMRKE